MKLAIALLAALPILGCAALSRSGSLDIALDRYMDGEYEGAIRAADQALRTGTPSDDDVARATLIKAHSYEQLGDTESAVGLYRYLIDTFPKSAEAYQARERLERIERR